MALTGLLSSGAESFRISEKEYENIDRMLQFGVQVFLNCLDKVREATEKLVKEDMLRTNRIAIQDKWNSFRETANRISVEERGKEAQDDLIVAARTVRRLVLHYKDDIKKTIHSLATEQNVQLYLPVVNMFKGTIERAKAKEILGTLVANYLPDAPSIESEPVEFLCYLLSTNTVETFIVNALKFGMDAISQLKRVDFDETSEWVRSTSFEVLRKFNEIERTEREKESDKFLLTVRVIVRMLLNKLGAFADRINADIDDHTIRSLITNWGNLKIICVKKLLASGALTQDELDEAERMFVNKMFGFLSKFDDLTQGMDRKRVEDIFKALVKLVMVGLNFIYAPLTQALDTVVI
ncbi:hypothetical protein SRHO_G00008920 [Serrasalmus rhombeus]